MYATQIVGMALMVLSLHTSVTAIEVIKTHTSVQAKMHSLAPTAPNYYQQQQLPKNLQGPNAVRQSGDTYYLGLNESYTGYIIFIMPNSGGCLPSVQSAVPNCVTVINNRCYNWVIQTPLPAPLRRVSYQTNSGMRMLVAFPADAPAATVTVRMTLGYNPTKCVIAGYELTKAWQAFTHIRPTGFHPPRTMAWSTYRDIIANALCTDMLQTMMPADCTVQHTIAFKRGATPPRRSVPTGNDGWLIVVVYLMVGVALLLRHQFLRLSAKQKKE